MGKPYQPCLVDGCPGRNSDSILLFRIPYFDREAWFRNLQFIPKKWVSCLRVCSRHFHPSDMGSKKLRLGARPTINLGHDKAVEKSFIKQFVKWNSRKCCIVNCKTTSPPSTVFQFPTNEEKAQIWEKNCYFKNNLTLGAKKYICAKHFDSSMIGAGRLLANAVPKCTGEELNALVETDSKDSDEMEYEDGPFEEQNVDIQSKENVASLKELPNEEGHNKNFLSPQSIENVDEDSHQKGLNENNFSPSDTCTPKFIQIVDAPNNIEIKIELPDEEESQHHAVDTEKVPNIPEPIDEQLQPLDWLYNKEQNEGDFAETNSSDSVSPNPNSPAKCGNCNKLREKAEMNEKKYLELKSSNEQMRILHENEIARYRSEQNQRIEEMRIQHEQEIARLQREERKRYKKIMVKHNKKIANFESLLQMMHSETNMWKTRVMEQETTIKYLQKR